MIEDTPYRGLFRGLRWRQRHYRAVFGSRNPSADAVMADLGKFCRLLSTTYETGQPEKDGWILEGRRQVMLRILEHVHLTTEELFTIFQGLDQESRMALFDNNRPGMPLSEG